jgi:hypothetical protein
LTGEKKMALIDLSHRFEEGMPGFRLRKEDGSYTQFTARIHPFLTREQMKPMSKETVPLRSQKCRFKPPSEHT